MLIAGHIYLLGNEVTYPATANVTLTAGTLTTTSNISAAPPTSGDYDLFITTDNGTPISSAGVSVPEPTSLGLLAVSAMALAGRRRRTR